MLNTSIKLPANAVVCQYPTSHPLKNAYFPSDIVIEVAAISSLVNSVVVFNYTASKVFTVYVTVTNGQCIISVSTLSQITHYYSFHLNFCPNAVSKCAKHVLQAFVDYVFTPEFTDSEAGKAMLASLVNILDSHVVS